MQSEQHVPSTPHPQTNRADRLWALVNNEAAFKTADCHPEADVRRRFGWERALIAHFVDGLVDERRAEWETLKEDIKAAKKDPADEEVRIEAEKIIKGLDDAITWYSRRFEEDAAAAQAPAVRKFYMNVWRSTLAHPDAGGRAPNGQLLNFYGPKGAPASSSLTTLRTCEDDVLRQFLISFLLQPLHYWIFEPTMAFFRRLFHLPGRDEEYKLNGRSLELAVSAIECVFSVGCIAGTVALLHHISPWKTSMVAASLLNIFFLYMSTFLSRNFVRLFAVTAAYWAVMVVFMASNSATSQRV